MLASPPSSTDVKPDQDLLEAYLRGQQHQHHLTPAAPRRTSYSLYYHNTQEPEVYPEFNWEEHSSVRLSDMGDQPAVPQDADGVAVKKNLEYDSPFALALPPYPGTASASPPSSSETFHSDGGTATVEMSTGRQAPQDDLNAEEPLRVSHKRPRPPSLTQWDNRCFDKHRHSHFTSPHSSPGSLGGPVIKQVKRENEDCSSLPPIVTREEIERSGAAAHDIAADLQFPAAHLQYPRRDSVAVDALSSSSVQRLPEANSTSLQLSSELAAFPVEDYHNSTNGIPATPHSATSISFASHQSQAQQIHFSTHRNGYLSALPSPGLPRQCNGNSQPGDRASYPGSPIMTLTAPNSATFPLQPNSSFHPLTSQLHSTSTPSHNNSLVCSSSIQYRPQERVFSSSAPPGPSGPSYASNDTTQQADAPHVTQIAAIPGAGLTTQTTQASTWNSTETPAPRRRGKLPSAVTSILKGWLMAHTTHPYPTEEEKKTLCQETNLTMNQVSNWFINARRRILVPPSAGNSVHEVRQPVRRQAQSQMARAAGSTDAVPPCLTIRHLGPMSHSATPSTGISMFSPVSAASPSLQSAGGNFDFRYPISHQSAHESPYHVEGLSVCRPPGGGTLSPCSSSQWPNPTSPLYSTHGHHSAVPYYPGPHSFQGYPHSHSASSTPIPSPHFTSSFPSSGPTHYLTPQARLHSPQPNTDSHPPTPTLSHSSPQNHSTPAFMSQTPCNNPSVTFPSNQDSEKYSLVQTAGSAKLRAI
ncbi:hypothetical protein VP01_331g2 [Puccinia sorghi]|uniref:Homeobox domain-containing protein n=1 Tax=Puccinia sorghi TaxID=27349 RepID=A0A0L6UY44_9BASI|nr:hypothetical protein VP01_331g2 [Puccinia sorghi]